MNASTIPTDVAEVLRARLRRASSRSSVPGSLPVLFFGDLLRATVATVGLNPSKLEYLDKSGEELQGRSRRFETLKSLGATSRETLTDDQVDRAVRTMRSYFHPGRPVYSSWFNHVGRVLKPLGTSYEVGLAIHLDLVQEATNPTWSELARLESLEAADLLHSDLPFLKWEVEKVAPNLVLCDGRTAFDNVVRLVDGSLVHTGTLKRVTWWLAKASIGSRSLIVAGWNIPLIRATGLGLTGEVELGEVIRRGAESAGARL